MKLGASRPEARWGPRRTVKLYRSKKSKLSSRSRGGTVHYCSHLIPNSQEFQRAVYLGLVTYGQVVNEEEWRYSVAPIPEEKLNKFYAKMFDEDETSSDEEQTGITENLCFWSHR